MVLFSDDFFRLLPDDHDAAALAICTTALVWMKTIENPPQRIDGAKALELLAVLAEFQSRSPYKSDLPSPHVPIPELLQGLINTVQVLKKRAEASLQKKTYESVRSAVAAQFQKGYALEFTDGDLKRIQQLINELRDYISKSKDFAEDHKQRVLRRLERLQGEIHKRMSDADRIFGLIGDAGVAIGKFGKNAKPIVDRIRELAEIAWKAQARAEELASDSPFPQLGHKEQNDRK